MAVRAIHHLFEKNSYFARRLAWLVLWLAFLALQTPAAYGFNLQNVQHLVVFGDSLSDNGNSLAAAGRPQPPYYYGRWTNGLNWVDFFFSIILASTNIPCR
jgi:phospholipase/lecithinase/hemolysin